MRSTVHLISGLPRSGSTVLSALLKQNPRFSAAVTSPVASLVGPLLQNMSGASEFAVFFNDERRRTVLKGVFDSYYAEVPADHVVFDTNSGLDRQTAAAARYLSDLPRHLLCSRDRMDHRQHRANAADQSAAAVQNIRLQAGNLDLCARRNADELGTRPHRIGVEQLA